VISWHRLFIFLAQGCISYCVVAISIIVVFPNELGTRVVTTPASASRYAVKLFCAKRFNDGTGCSLAFGTPSSKTLATMSVSEFVVAGKAGPSGLIVLEATFAISTITDVVYVAGSTAFWHAAVTIIHRCTTTTACRSRNSVGAFLWCVGGQRNLACATLKSHRALNLQKNF